MKKQTHNSVGLILHPHTAGKHLLQFTASLFPGGLVSFTPSDLHKNEPLMHHTTVVMQMVADSL